MGFTAAERQQVWLKYCGRVFESKCSIVWCDNTMNAFQFHVGHNKPRADGGPDTLDNLVPICANCNLSMGKKYTIDQWNKLHKVAPKRKFACCLCY